MRKLARKFIVQSDREEQLQVAPNGRIEKFSPKSEKYGMNESEISLRHRFSNKASDSDDISTKTTDQWAKNGDCQELDNKFPRYRPTELPSECPIQFVKISSIGTSYDLEHRPFTVYSLEVRSTMTMPSSWKVYRRFSQFSRLRTSLQEVYGLAIPVLPLLHAEFNQEVILNKAKALEAWLCSLMEYHLHFSGSEPLNHHPLLRRFLSSHYDVLPPEWTEWYIVPCESVLPSPATISDNEICSKICLDDFHLVKSIGKGAFGRVSLVRKKVSQKLYAMKTIRKADITREKQYDHALRERSILLRLSSPFIVKMHYAFKTPQTLFFVLEYAPGGDLLFRLNKCRTFSEDVAQFYCAEICLALEHMHSKDILYRDLKPENVLLDAEGHIKLVDFGLAREHVSSATTGAKSFAGTEQYLAPEILDGCEYGFAVDWWALGMVLFEILTGLPPWYTYNDRDTLFASIRYAPLKFPRTIARRSAQFIQNLLIRDPLRRLGSKRGACDVRQHVYFHNIHWGEIESKYIAPPIQPCESQADQEEARNFEEDFLSMPLNDYFASDLRSTSSIDQMSTSCNSTSDYLTQFHKYSDSTSMQSTIDEASPRHQAGALKSHHTSNVKYHFPSAYAHSTSHYNSHSNRSSASCDFSCGSFDLDERFAAFAYEEDTEEEATGVSEGGRLSSSASSACSASSSRSLRAQQLLFG